MKYRIENAASVDELIAIVQKLLDDGWTLQGGVAMSDDGFSQALTK